MNDNWIYISLKKMGKEFKLHGFDYEEFGNILERYAPDVEALTKERDTLKSNLTKCNILANDNAVLADKFCAKNTNLKSHIANLVEVVEEVRDGLRKTYKAFMCETDPVWNLLVEILDYSIRLRTALADYEREKGEK